MAPFRYLCARRIFNDLFAEMIERQGFAVNELTPRRSIGSSRWKREAKSACRTRTRIGGVNLRTLGYPGCG